MMGERLAMMIVTEEAIFLGSKGPPPARWRTLHGSPSIEEVDEIECWVWFSQFIFHGPIGFSSAEFSFAIASTPLPLSIGDHHPRP